MKPPWKNIQSYILMSCRLYSEIYFLENRLREKNLSNDEIKKKILPILNEFHDWLVAIQPSVVPEVKFGKAISYVLNSWQHILIYIECPYISMCLDGSQCFFV